jgi:hypothetical protein
LQINEVLEAADMVTEQANAGGYQATDHDVLSRRLAQVERRIARIQSWWDNEEVYDSIVSSGRYLKLCVATEMASESADLLRERAVEALASIGAQGRPRVASVDSDKQARRA